MKFPLRFLIIFISALFTMPCAQAQQHQVRGVVTDKYGNPLEGVGVEEPQSKIRSHTDADGRFSIAADTGSILIVTYLGEKQEFNVNNTPFIKIVINTDVNLEEVVVLGSRTGFRSRLKSPVPVDVFDMERLSGQSPSGTLSRMLNATVPSFSSVTHSAMNLTDHVDPATLRGMSPDQTLVLLNEKRLHASSLINVTGGTSMGSVGTDLNTIPAFALQKTEVLRDGASAQYGSDAIAGVINLEMKRSTNGLSGQVTFGGYLTKEADNFHGNWDGAQVQADLNFGTKIGKRSGFLNITGTYQHHDRTARSMDKAGQLYNIYNAIYSRASADGIDLSKLYGNINYLQGQDLAQFVGLIKNYALQVKYLEPAVQQQIQDASGLPALQTILKGNATDPELAYRSLQRSDFSMQVGQPETGVYQLFFNTEIPLKNNWKIYGFGGYNHRNGSAAGYYRYPYQGTSLPSLYPNGYLPHTHSNLNDYTITAGTKGKWGVWDMDFSNTLGENNVDFTSANTANASLRFNSPTKMKIGGFDFLQNTVNLDFRRSVNVLSGLNLAFGTEYRYDHYRLKPGEPLTYQTYDLQGKPITATTPNSDRATDFFGNILGGNSQGFGGFNPANNVSEDRNSFAVYGESEINFTDWLLLDGALRYEHYSDFGSTVNFKLASLIRLAEHLNFRMAGSTGFRAPSLAQTYYNTTSGLLTNGVAKSVGLFRNDSQLAGLLGIPPLTEEKSVSLSAGFTYQIPEAGLSFTADAFYTKVKNQIILTGIFSAPSGTNLSPAQQEVLDIYNDRNIVASEFFANAIDVRNMGADFIISHRFRSGNGLIYRNDLGLNLNQVKRVGEIHASPLLEEAGLVGAYFDEHAKTYLERSTPRIKINLMNEIAIRRINIFLQNGYYGSVWGADNINAFEPNKPYVHPVHGGRIITDLSVGYRLKKEIKLTLGSGNLFDVYPSRNVPQLAYDNQFPYDVRVSQISLNGRYVFARINFSIL